MKEAFSVEGGYVKRFSPLSDLILSVRINVKKKQNVDFPGL
jgi:hypothetical protein